MSRSVVCHKCNVTFKYPELYEEHLRNDKSCPDEAIELHHLNLIGPRFEGQRRIIQLDLIIPIRIEMLAAWRGGSLRWTTVSVISDASFAQEE